MRASLKLLRNGSRATNIAIVVALHLGLAVAFIGCGGPAARMVARAPEPLSMPVVAEMREGSPPPPPQMAMPMERNYVLASPSALAPSAMFPTEVPTREQLVDEKPVSTFSIDVDTASYAFVRHMLNQGTLPPTTAVRVEEMVNYFPYNYATPASAAEPFGVSTELMPSPWNAGNQLLHIAVRGYDIQASVRPPTNVVLLIDVSGSMGPDDRLPLLKKGFRMFAAQMRDQDRISIVTYASGTSVVLEPTLGKDRNKVIAAIDALGSGGGTAGGEGLERAYAMAERHFDPKAVNRIILATDGDFNIGISDPKELEKFVARKRKTGIYLSIFGVGDDNLNDALIQRLAQSGNGNAAYIDSMQEARKALSEELGSTMFPIANDVKVQVEFNPKLVAGYRLIGYETRMLERQDFKDDKVDAGDMGAGHTVTAIYEITPAGAKGKLVDPLRYRKAQGANASAAQGKKDELCFIKLRYKLPGEAVSNLTTHVVHAALARKSMAEVPEEKRFAVAVAAFGQRLRDEKDVSDFSYAEIIKLADSGRGADPQGYRAEFIKLVRLAETLGSKATTAQR
jgi:Ca-activated chloride channel family protein